MCHPEKETSLAGGLAASPDGRNSVSWSARDWGSTTLRRRLLRSNIVAVGDARTWCAHRIGVSVRALPGYWASSIAQERR